VKGKGERRKEEVIGWICSDELEEIEKKRPRSGGRGRHGNKGSRGWGRNTKGESNLRVPKKGTTGEEGGDFPRFIFVYTRGQGI